MQIRLETAQGEFVGKGQCPEFDPPPTVVLWGDRVFVFHVFEDDGTVKTAEADAEIPPATGENVFREVFGIAITGALDGPDLKGPDQGHGFSHPPGA